MTYVIHCYLIVTVINECLLFHNTAKNQTSLETNKHISYIALHRTSADIKSNPFEFGMTA